MTLKTGWKRGLKGAGILLFCFFFSYGAASFLNDYIIQYETIEGSSMEPFLEDKEHVFLSPVPFWFKTPERFQVVAFTWNHELYVKRIIGLPGETVSIKNGIIYIDEKNLPENYGNAPFTQDMEPVTLGNDEYFVLGDNRNASMDSRSKDMGPVSEKQIEGKVVFR